MLKGDISTYVDLGGVEHVVAVTEAHTDGTVDLAILKTNLRNIPRAAAPAPGKFFDPSWVDPAPAVEPTLEFPAPSGLSSVPQEEAFESPAHGAPADVEQPEETPSTRGKKHR